jgi:hypothetical protein
MARTVRLIAGALLVVVGAVWFLQGIDVIKGSFMTGQPTWALLGAVCAIAGSWLLIGARRAT